MKKSFIADWKYILAQFVSLLITNIVFVKNLLHIWQLLIWLIKLQVIDLSKAFDKVDHTILLKKLSLYGICSMPYDLRKSYLYDQWQYDSFNNVASPLTKINCEIPQGSILGPLLFLIYVDDIKFSSDILKFIFFADDTNIFLSGLNINDLFHLESCSFCWTGRVLLKGGILLTFEAKYLHYHLS